MVTAGAALWCTGGGAGLFGFFFDGQSGIGGVVDPIDEAAMLRVNLRAAVIVGRIVMVAERLRSGGQLKRESVREQPEQQLARIALANEISQGLQVDRSQEALIEGAGFLGRDVEVGADRGGVGGGGVA